MPEHEPPTRSRLVGRTAEVAMLEGLCGVARIVTVLGPPGAGKTALASYVAERLSRRRGIVVLHGHRVEAGERHAAAPILLVLDGCEADVGACALLASQVLDGHTDSLVLATSHVPLGVEGEVRWTLPPLSLPEAGASPATLLASGAGALLVHEARHAGWRGALDAAAAGTISSICRDVGGHPLALALVAERMRRDGLESAALEIEPSGTRRPGWFVRLAPPAELDVLCALVDLPAPVTLDALAYVIGTARCPEHGSSAPSTEELDQVLALLCERSLVARTVSGREAAYEVTRTVRQEAASGHLHGAGASGAYLDRLLEWCTRELAGAREAMLAGPDQRAWLDWIECHRACLEAALEAALDTGDIYRAAAMAAEMWRFWEIRGHAGSGRHWMELVLSQPSHGAELDDSLILHLLDGLGMLAWRQGDHSFAEKCFEEALACDTASAAPSLGARLQNHLGLAASFSGDVERARSLFIESADRHREHGTPAEEALALANLGLAEASLGELGAGKAAIERALAIEGAGGDRHAIAIATLHLGIVTVLEDRLTEALGCFRRAAAGLMELGDERSAAYALAGMAAALARQDPERALMLAASSTRAEERLGTPLPASHLELAAAFMLPAWASLGPAAHEAWNAGCTMTLESALELALDPLPADTHGPHGERRGEHRDPGGEHRGEHRDRRGAAAAPGCGQAGRGAEVLLLGPFRVTWQGEDLLIEGQARRALTAVACAGGSLHLEMLAEWLWPEVSPDVGRRRLRNVLARAKAPAGRLLVRSGESISFPGWVQVDALVFARLAEEALAAMRSREESGAALARAALGLYAGDALVDQSYDAWAIEARERLARLRLRLLDALAARAEDASDHEAAARWLDLAIACDPVDEGRYVKRARMLADLGRPAAAFALLDAAAQVEARLGVAPSRELVALREAITIG